MAEPTQNNVDEQIKQAQQNALQQSAALQGSEPQGAANVSAPTVAPPPPIPPTPPTLPISTPIKPTSGVKKKGIDVTMSKLSLFTIALCLIFFGALTFLGGFFIGAWFSTPKNYASSMNMGYAPYDGYQQQLGPSQPQYNAGFDIPANYPRQAGAAVQSGVSSMSVPGVPSPLNPLVSATQSAIGEQIGKKLRQELTQVPGGQSLTPQGPSPTQMAPAANPALQSKIPGQSSLMPSPSPASRQPSKSSNSPEGKGDYMVQLGVYASPENANTLVNHLQTLNLISSVKETKSQHGSPLYYVYSGSYADYALALKAASRFAAYNIPGAIVVKAKPPSKEGK